MAKVYALRCRDIGVDCDYETRGANPEQVIEHCAEHGRQQHGLRGFGSDLYLKMRAGLRVIDEEQTPG